MVCSISPYFTDEELIETFRMVMKNYDMMWHADWEHILNSIQEGPTHFWIYLTFGDGSHQIASIDKYTGGIVLEDR